MLSIHHDQGTELKFPACKIIESQEPLYKVENSTLMTCILKAKNLKHRELQHSFQHHTQRKVP